MKFNSYTVIVTNNETGKTLHTTEWEVDGSIVPAAQMALAGIIRILGTSDITFTIDYFNA